MLQEHFLRIEHRASSARERACIVGRAYTHRGLASRRVIARDVHQLRLGVRANPGPERRSSSTWSHQATGSLSLSLPLECRGASVSISPRLPNSHGCDVRDRDRLRQRELLCGCGTRRWHRDYSQRLQSSEHTVSQSRDYPPPPPDAHSRTSHALAKDTGIAPPVSSSRP